MSQADFIDFEKPASPVRKGISINTKSCVLEKHTAQNGRGAAAEPHCHHEVLNLVTDSLK